MSLYQQGVTLKALLENPDLLNPPKLNKEAKEKKDGELVDNDLFLGQSAFLGPTLWDKTLPVDVSDFKLEYMDLDEFLNENGLVDNPENNDKKEDSSAPVPAVAQQQQPKQQESPAKPSPVEPEEKPVASSDQGSDNPNDIPSPDPNVEFDVPEGDLALATIPGQQFDPKKRAFTEEELRPQPMIKKSKKVFVPEDLKDDRYWQRRKKNNVAAKRSRDARRIKENQIAMRASFLEKENDKLREDMEQMNNENKLLKSRLLKYEPDFVSP